MKRRTFIGLVGAAAVWPAAARARKDVPIVVVLVPGPAKNAENRIIAIRQGMREAGLAEGTDFVFAARYADGVFDRLPALALELAALKPRVIIASAAAAPVAHKVLPDLPLIFTSYAADPIKAGFAESYVHPGGHATGNVMNAIGGEEALTQKRLNLFKELVPDLKLLGFIGSSSILAAAELTALRSVGGQFGFEVVHHPLRGLDDVEGAVSASIQDGAGALYVSGEPLLYNNMPRVLPLVTAPGKPTVGTYPEWGRAGLLMSYSADLIDDFRRAGIYAAKVLGGEKPADLPIEQASKFVLVLNLKTAKSLGIAAPDRLLTVADEVIE
ncbi:ABC transporter substrate-binding protein [Bradyrhizobium sp. 1]|uniref:ABC transporter substrate-binding protein n=1 Tax=Bradyrhizobium sp. 1 TaxID=241591 RepID=UPI001FF750B2|nr:ABC transporter substrate-binding protein [Bradyrhizobium sp. 1]MCK1390759.1 ABC transporter substrate-binding protein [Bradyrhizobium sp. 1]